MTDLERAFRRKCKIQVGLDEVPEELWEAFDEEIQPLANADRIFQFDMLSDIIHSWMMRKIVSHGRLLADTVKDSVGNTIWKYAFVSAVSVFVTCMAFVLALFFNKPDGFWKTTEGRQVQALRDAGDLRLFLDFADSDAGKLAIAYPPETLRSILLCERQGWKIENRDGSLVCIPGTGFRMLGKQAN